MEKFMDWVTNKFQHPLSLLFFILGAILILLGLTTGISVPGLQQITPDVNFRWVSLGFGTVFILLSILLYYRPPRAVSTTDATKASSLPPADHFTTRLGTNSERFIERLSQAERITVIGITNQHLVHHLEKALEVKRKNQNPGSFWQSIRIVFLSETALNTVHDELRTEYADKNAANLARTRNAGSAKRAISYFFIRTLHSHEWSLFEYDAMTPFVGVIYEMPNGRTIVEVATLRPHAGQAELLYFEFSDEFMPQIVKYYKNVFDDVVQQSTKHDEIVVVGNPVPQGNGFIWKHSKFRRSVLESNPHSDNWIAVVMVMLWRKNEEGDIEPLLQVRTPENASRELDTLSNIAGYINQRDCQDFDGISATDVVLQKSAYDRAVYRELQEELGVKRGWLKPELIDEIRFYYPDKENLFFYVCSVEVDFPLFHIEPNAHMRPWNFQQILKVREHQVLSRVHATLETAPNKMPSPLAIDVLADNLVLHQQDELADMLHDSIHSHSIQRDEMQNKVNKLMEQNSQFYVFQNTRRQIRGLAELQYREFFSTLLNAYSQLGIPGAQEYQDLIVKNTNMSNALGRLRKFYGSEALIRKVGMDI